LATRDEHKRKRLALGDRLKTPIPLIEGGGGGSSNKGENYLVFNLVGIEFQKEKEQQGEYGGEETKCFSGGPRISGSPRKGEEKDVSG